MAVLTDGLGLTNGVNLTDGVSLNNGVSLTNSAALTKIDFLPVKLRSYQTEMFEQSLAGNTIVVMETGSGKTPVAIHRMMHALEQIQDDKLIWFLTEGVALCRQQHAAASRAIPGAVMKVIVGPDGPELWGSVKTWEDVLRGVQIAFSTFEVLHLALGHGFVHMERLELLIFDEGKCLNLQAITSMSFAECVPAHHVTKDHPSNMIMKKFYHPRISTERSYKLPAILGLTASPAENGRIKKLSDLERNLAAICKTPRKHRLEMRQYVHRPSLERLEYTEDGGSSLAWASLSEHFCESAGAPIGLREALGRISKKAAHLAQELGYGAALRFLEEMERLLHGKINKEAFGFAASLTSNKVALVTLLKPMIEQLARIHTQLARAQQLPLHMSDKAQCFFRHLKSVAGKLGKGLVAIVFIRQRVAAAMLEKLIANHEDLTEIHSAVFVGESNSVSYEKELSELVVPRTQVDALRAFRDGEINLIVATDALDEGIDVAECNTIICFDPPQNLRSFIQKRGRARKQESTYTIMAPRGWVTTSPGTFEQMEEIMSAAIQQERREAVFAARQETIDECVSYSLRSKSTEAFLTAQMTRAHLEHFCAKLPRPAYTESRPVFSCEKAELGRISATVQLPMSVPADARIAVSKKSWCTERAAIKDAAFQAYKGLYDCGLLNEHLLPIDNSPVFDEDFKRQTRQFHHLGSRLCAWETLSRCEAPTQLFRTPIAIYDDASKRVVPRVVLWTRKDLSSVEDFALFSGDRELTVGLQASVMVELGVDELWDTLAKCTRQLVESIRSTPLPASGAEVDFAVFITPDLPLEHLPLWLHNYSGSIPADQHYRQGAADAKGLVIDTANGNSLHVFRKWNSAEDDAGEPLLEIECSPFPKRRNFLETTASSHVLTDEEEAAADRAVFIKARRCLVKLVPIGYSWAMRFMPSIFYHLELTFLSERLGQTLLAPVQFGLLSNLTCCIASSATMLVANYERLEFLGDSILKFHVTQQLYCDYPNWHEEHLTRKRNTIISNICLAKAAVAFGIDRFIQHESFIGKNWTVPSNESIAKQDGAERHLRMKILADVMEALIGAAFVGGGLESARRCMSILLPDARETIEVSKLALESLPVRDHASTMLEQAQSLVGYTFRGKYLFLQALTHPSCTRAINSEPYQRLEYLGDAVLDYVVATDLFALLPHGSQSRMTKVKASLVNANYLAYLCYSCSALVEGVAYSAAAREPVKRHLTQEHKGLWMMMRYEGEAVINASRDCFDRFRRLQQPIATAFAHGKKYPWEELCMLNAPKFISDIVESILGAIFVDSGGDLEPCRAFLEKIGLLPQLRQTITSGMIVDHPKEELTRWTGGCKVQYDWKDQTSERDGLGLKLLVDGKELADVSGCMSRSEAIIKATKAASKRFEDEFALQ